jgi:ABC-type uncharacterized transport system involved in gliding motility auxiliary subunit
MVFRNLGLGHCLGLCKDVLPFVSFDQEDTAERTVGSVHISLAQARQLLQVLLLCIL